LFTNRRRGMTETAVRARRMAGRKKESFSRGRVEFMADPAWIERATRVAEQQGFGNLAAMIRFVLTRYLNEVDPLPEGPEKGGRPMTAPRRRVTVRPAAVPDVADDDVAAALRPLAELLLQAAAKQRERAGAKTGRPAGGKEKRPRRQKGQ